MKIVTLQQNIVGKRINGPVKNSVRSATGEVPEGLRRYPLCEWTVKKINKSYNNIAGLRKQKL